jgi:hypothetical protein
LCSCCCSLLVRINVLEHLDASSGLTVKSETVVALPLGSGLDSSASLRALCFRISTRWSRMWSWSWGFRSSKTSLQLYARIHGRDLIYWVWE